MRSTSRRRFRRLRALMALAVLPTLVAACAAGEGGQSATQPAPAADEVVIDLVAYMPETIEVDVGRSVTWQQEDAGAHTVTSGTVEQGAAGVTQRPDGRFDSGDIPSGDRFEFTFDEAGTYPYFCTLHPATMRGEVRVG